MQSEHKNRIESIATILGEAKKQMIETSSLLAQSGGDWDAAQRLLARAREIDAIRSDLDNMIRSGPILFNMPRDREPLHANLPYYQIEDDRLVKVGKSRNGGTYKHRVPKEHYDIIVAKLVDFARSGRPYFLTQDLIDRHDMPNHEPNLVINLLEEKAVVRRVTRGRYAFSHREAIQEQAETIWRELPRQ